LLRDSSKHVVWEDGKPTPRVALARGATSILDLRRAVTAHSMDPFHCVAFTVPLQALDESIDDRLSDLSFAEPWRFGFDDPVIRALGGALQPALARPEAASRLFVDHVLLALRAHVAWRFGVEADGATRPGRLTARRERRVREFIEAHLAENISLADLAGECGLSAAHFARAFRRSMGMAPHQFLTARRIERARDLLIHTTLPLAEVAARCGFSDQSHFTKVFRRLAGASPGSFRATSRTVPPLPCP
jgi:AraC-like DNA-binding protein